METEPQKPRRRGRPSPYSTEQVDDFLVVLEWLLQADERNIVPWCSKITWGEFLKTVGNPGLAEFDEAGNRANPIPAALRISAGATCLPESLVFLGVDTVHLRRMQMRRGVTTEEQRRGLYFRGGERSKRAVEGAPRAEAVLEQDWQADVDWKLGDVKEAP